MNNCPLVIAHRGASGYLPEHTLAAKALAHQQGADYLEQDVIATRDGRLIVCHDIYLDRMTNVAEFYSQRARDDGHHYAIDFDWEEIRKLTVIGTGTAACEAASAAAGVAEDQRWRLCTLEEEIAFIRELNSKSGRSAGIYPEIKQPRWHTLHGFDLSAAVLETLAGHGYDRSDGSVFVQCFDATELKRVKFNLGSNLPLIQLVGRSSDPRLLSKSGLAGIAEYAAGLAPNYRQLLRSRVGGPPVSSPLARRARSSGLKLHPYTFNNDGIPAYAMNLEQLLRTAYEVVAPDAVFCDFPDIAIKARADRPVSGGRGLA
jgi:glycerophosphoryl diester phosphodiesterase